MIDLEKLMELHDAATPGPWKAKIGDFESEDGYGTVTAPYVEADGKTICVPTDRGPDDDNDEDDAAYIVAACNSVPDLVARIRELEARAEFWQRAAVKLAKSICLECPDNKGNCPRRGIEQHGREYVEACRMKHARLAVEAEMIRKGKVPGRMEA